MYLDLDRCCWRDNWRRYLLTRFIVLLDWVDRWHLIGSSLLFRFSLLRVTGLCCLALRRFSSSLEGRYPSLSLKKECRLFFGIGLECRQGLVIAGMALCRILVRWTLHKCSCRVDLRNARWCRVGRSFLLLQVEILEVFRRQLSYFVRWDWG